MSFQKIVANLKKKREFSNASEKNYFNCFKINGAGFISEPAPLLYGVLSM